jgi:hypothetical protein
MCGTGTVSIPQPAPHPLRTSSLGGPHYSYIAFLTLVVEGREHKELEPERDVTGIQKLLDNSSNTTVTKWECMFLMLSSSYHFQIYFPVLSYSSGNTC